jgi:putative transposase
MEVYLQRFFMRLQKVFNHTPGETENETPQMIISMMQLYFTGESLRNVQKFLRLQGVSVSHRASTSELESVFDPLK